MKERKITGSIALLFALLSLVGLGVAQAEPGARRGGLALQFDDGWSSWATLIAPELARVGGKATVFVNNKYINNGRITLDDLRTLQDTYGWEIGTHTINHLNAPRFVAQNGVEAWINQELDPAMAELTAAGLNVKSLVYPFNASTPELDRAVMGRVESFRRSDNIALAPGPRADGSLPGTSIDSTRYAPPALLQQWIDLAQSQDQILFLFGHRVLPDDAFVTGKVVAVEEDGVLVDVDVKLPSEEEDYVMVPDLSRRTLASQPLRVLSADGKKIFLDGGDLEKAASPGSSFLIGPSYGTRLSDFKALIEYASSRLPFLTIHEVVTRQGWKPE